MTHGKAPTATRSTLVISAHAGDFAGRAGGAIALAASRGEKATGPDVMLTHPLADPLGTFGVERGLTAPSRPSPPRTGALPTTARRSATSSPTRPSPVWTTACRPC